MSLRRTGRLCQDAPHQIGPDRAHSTPAGAARRDGVLAWYRCYPGDHLRQTRGWSLVARAIYRELLDAQWDTGSLPADPEQLRAMVRATEEEWRTGWPSVQALFPVRRGRRQNRELERL